MSRKINLDIPVFVMPETLREIVGKKVLQRDNNKRFNLTDSFVGIDYEGPRERIMSVFARSAKKNNKSIFKASKKCLCNHGQKVYTMCQQQGIAPKTLNIWIYRACKKANLFVYGGGDYIYK